jgi:hypothetical protein
MPMFAQILLRAQGGRWAEHAPILTQTLGAKLYQSCCDVMWAVTPASALGGSMYQQHHRVVPV